MLRKDKALCIRTVDYSETSQILTLFCRDAGKISAIAKGSKRPRSSFEGPIEILSFGSVVYTHKPEANLATLTEFQQAPMASVLTRNYLALNAGLFVAELTNLLTEEYDPHPELFDSLLEFLQNLSEAKDSSQVLRLLILVQLTILNEIGLKPVLSHCVNCKNPFTPQWKRTWFSYSANGLICRDCEDAFIDRSSLSPQVAKCLAKLSNITSADLQTLKGIEKLLIYHFTNILHRPPKMAKYILNA